MNSNDYIVYIVIVLTGNMHIILANMDLAVTLYFRRYCEHNNVQCYFAV